MTFDDLTGDLKALPGWVELGVRDLVREVSSRVDSPFAIFGEAIYRKKKATKGPARLEASRIAQACFLLMNPEDCRSLVADPVIAAAYQQACAGVAPLVLGSPPQTL